jgi:hypothetical protein
MALKSTSTLESMARAKKEPRSERPNATKSHVPFL